jgi:hypothetical protein
MDTKILYVHCLSWSTTIVVVGVKLQEILFECDFIASFTKFVKTDEIMRNRLSPPRDFQVAVGTADWYTVFSYQSYHMCTIFSHLSSQQQLFVSNDVIKFRDINSVPSFFIELNVGNHYSWLA